MTLAAGETMGRFYEDFGAGNIDAALAASPRIWRSSIPVWARSVAASVSANT